MKSMKLKKEGSRSVLLRSMGCLLMSYFFWAPLQTTWAQDNTQKNSLVYQQVLERVAADLNVPLDSLKILSEKVHHFQNLEKDIRIIIVNLEMPERGKSFEVALDENDQILTLNASEIVDQDQMAGKLKYGKYEGPGLFKEIQSLGPTDTIEVLLWIKYHDPLPQITDEEYRTKTREQLDQERMQALKEKEKRLSLALKPTLDKIEQLRAQIKHVSTGLPHITIIATRAQLDEISKWDEVDTIYKGGNDGGMPFLDNSSGTINAPSAWNQAISGQNTTVAVIEADGVDFGNTFLAGKGSNRTELCGTQDSKSMLNYHATQVAGVIASTSPTYKGVAYDAGLLGGTSCTFQGDDVITASLWAISHGARVLNNSWGRTPTTPAYPVDLLSRSYDELVNENLVTVVAATGNCLDTTTGVYDCHVSAPAIAYNVIGVGGYHDHNTATVSDDTIDNFSSYIDPTPGSGKPATSKPEVSAPSVFIKTTSQTTSEGSLTPGKGVSGTSVAAPHVAAAADLMIQANSSLSDKPEAVKAILMASAIHNIEGPSQFSDQDGAGGIDIDQAIKVAKNLNNKNKWVYEVINSGTFSTRDCDGMHDEICYTFFADNGVRVRAVITWSVTSYYAGYNTGPGSHLFFEIEKSPANEVCASESCGEVHGNFAIYEFVSDAAATYYLNVHNSQFSDSSVRLGIAWNTSPNSGMENIVDTDGDGMADNYEDYYGLNKNVRDNNPGAYANNDTDGLSNITEFYLGTPPNSNTSFFSNTPLIQRQSIIRAEDIYELRDIVSAMLSSVNLSASWTHPKFVGLPVSAVDIEELRTYLTQALQARGYSAPTWTHPSPLSGAIIYKDDIQQVRNAVK